MNNIIKIIDEHEINREAKIITYISLDGNDYAVYTISRDEENANIFVSKVINSSFVNITDANEKFKLDNFVKNLIKRSVDNSSLDDVKFTNFKVVDGQRINVKETYVATIKKDIATKAINYYSDKFTSIKDTDSIFSDSSVIFEEPKVDSNVLPESNNLNVSTPNVLATEAVAVPNPNPNPNPNPSSLGGQTVDNTIVSSALNDVTTENIINPVVLDNNVKTVDNNVGVQQTSSSTVSVLNNNIPNDVEATQVMSPVNGNVQSTTTSSVLNNNVFFDASKETNLLGALKEEDKVNKGNISVSEQNLETVREFGTDDNVTFQGAPIQEVKNIVQPKNSAMQGFMNNKFVMVIAILFFLASCVFLGYEMFSFFTLEK